LTVSEDWVVLRARQDGWDNAVDGLVVVVMAGALFLEFRGSFFWA